MSELTRGLSDEPSRLSNIDHRLTWSFGGLIFTLMVLVLLAGGWYLRGVMEREQDRLATLTTQVLGNAVSRVSFSGKYHARLLLEEIKAEQPDILYLRLVDANGVVLAHSDPKQNDKALDPRAVADVRTVLAENPRQLVKRFKRSGESVREVSLAYRGGYDNATVGVIQVGISETLRETALRDGVVYISVLILILLVPGIFITLRISAHFASPVRKLALALERERSYLQTLVGTIPDLVWLKDPDGVYLACNRAFEQFFGANETEIVGKRDHDFIADELAEFFRQKDKDAMAADRPTVNEEWVTFAVGGQKVLLETTKIPMYASTGELIGVLGIGHDITEHRDIQNELAKHRDHLEEVVLERTAELLAAKKEAEAANAETRLALENLRRAQDELVRTEKIAGLGALVAGVSHELNTPIGNAMLAASTLRGQYSEFLQAIQEGMRRSTLKHYLDLVGDGVIIILRNLERAAQLISSFKQVAVDQTSYQRRPFNLKDVVDEIVLTIAPTLRHANVELKVEIADDMQFDSYPGPLGQILVNLINNAVVHAFEPGVLGEVLIQALPHQDRIELQVSDNGKGILPENLGHIYDPFFTTRMGKGGSGLGLHIVHTLVTELLGGEIFVESVVGSGTTFRILLPPTAPTPENPEHYADGDT